MKLIAISTGTLNPTGIDGDKAGKLYKLEMGAYEGEGSIYSRTSKYLGQYDSGGSILSPKASSLIGC